MRGTEAREVPLASLLQPIVRELVVSATLFVGSLRPAGSTVVTSHQAPTVMLARAEPAIFATSVDDPAPTANAAPALPTCTVVPRDSLWKLAEDHLGDGLRWRDIWLLNQGRAFPDGRHFGDPNLIQPGWVLVLPADASGVDPVADSPAPPPRPAVQPSSPPSPVSTTITSPPTTVASAESASSNGHDQMPASGDSSDDPDYSIAPLLAGSALVAAGVVASVSRLRRRQRQHRAPGRAPGLPEPSAARAELHLRRAAVDAPFERVDLALRLFAHCLGRRRPGACPAIAAVSVGPDAIEILLTEEVDAPTAPFTVTAGGRAWTLPASVPDDDLHPVAHSQGGPAPALVTVGTVDERSVLIDLEAGSRTLVGGDRADAERLLWTIAIELATSNRADDVNLVLCGRPPAGIDVLDRVKIVDEIDNVIDELEAEAAAITTTLAARRRCSTLDARAADPSDTATPTVVLVASAPRKAVLDRLLDAASNHSGLAVVAATDVDGEFDRELCVEGDTLIVKPLGLQLVPAALPSDVLCATGDLLRAAADLDPGEQLDLDLHSNGDVERGLTIGPDHAPLELDTRGQLLVPPGHVMVRVLGPVEIVGGSQPIDRRRSIELVTYLALHPEGVDDSRLRDVLWPEAAPTQAAFNETVSRARRLLGLDAEGAHHLRPVDNGRYRVGPYVVADASLLEGYATGQGSPEVLRLVRGLPFEASERGYEWAYEEGQAHRLAALIDELQLQAATDAASSDSEDRAARI